jgi:hypothetical protein
MAELDCESPESVLCSLATIYGTDERQLSNFFASLDLEEHFRRTTPELPADRELQRLLETAIGPQRIAISRTYWFHLTRVPSGTLFGEGILPLNEALPKVWAMLDDILAGTHHQAQIRQLRQARVPNSHFNLKVPDRAHWGPYAMLVREIAFCADSVSHHDYLKLPEIVEDICNGYAQRFGEDIQSTGEQALAPTIVKFWMSEPEHTYGLSSAICYAYASRNKEEPRGSANTCFDGNGQRVPAERIVSISPASTRDA